ncbi:MAG: hypothetical protein HKN47_06180 [Pirellulaceae bacterium]|nr:hypothetical protein [Pirellulaceae bacterium]
MSRRKKSIPSKKASSSDKTRSSASGQTSKPAGDTLRGDMAAAANSRDAIHPGRTLRTLLTIGLLVHFAAILTTLSSSVDASQIQSSLLSLLHPYLQATHFRVDGDPIYLSHGERSEQPLRLQFAGVAQSQDASADGQTIREATQWTSVGPLGVSGMAANDRYARWMSTLVTLAENDQPSLVAEMLLPLLRNNSSVYAVRIIRLPTELSTVADDALPPPFIAKVNRQGDSVSLIRLAEERMSTMPARSTSSDKDVTSGGNSDE